MTQPDFVQLHKVQAVSAFHSRYESFSEFLHDLRHPNAKYVKTASAPLIERNPLLLWKTTTIVLALTVIVLLAMLKGLHR